MRISDWSSDVCSSDLLPSRLTTTVHVHWAALLTFRMTTLIRTDPRASPGCTPGTASPAGWPCCPPARPPCRRSSRSRDPGSGRYRPSLPCFPLLGQVLTPSDRALPRHRPLLGSSEDAQDRKSTRLNSSH